MRIVNTGYRGIGGKIGAIAKHFEERLIWTKELDNTIFINTDNVYYVEQLTLHHLDKTPPNFFSICKLSV